MFDPNEPAGIEYLAYLFSYVITIFVALAFVALVVMLVWAGVKFLVSGGEPKAIQSAGQTVTWALLGMLFLVIAWIILKLIETITGVPVTIFSPGVLL